MNLAYMRLKLEREPERCQKGGKYAESQVGAGKVNNFQNVRETVREERERAKPLLVL